ncbi:N-methyl-L-tryptophan oxidase [Halorussus halophilus]|uniref:N-methyl-L-tryptophan oxidase n=1 Tax=Halorussus halophilus TaxID=2650975 RepID=UPI00130166D8|nr:N-methyl-L-tryptophan oxidase [Halorussus halophilus]
MTTEDYDVIVLGVGGMGSATVSELARRGLDVLGIERFDVPNARGSSHGVTRIIRLPQYEDPAYVPLVRRALDRWMELDERYDRPLFHQVGSVDFGPSGSGVFEGSRRSAELHDIDHEVLSGEELNDRFPGYDVPDDYRAVYQVDGGFLHSEQCIVAHVEDAHAHGATVRAREQVEAWDADESGVRVTTDRGDYSAEKLVVTAGAWTGQLVPTLADYLQPERQVLGWLQPKQPPQFDPERFPVFVGEVPEGHYYGFPVYDVPGFKLGRFHHREETGNPAELDTEPDREDERLLRTFTSEYFPTASGPTMRLSTCMFTNTPDEDFILDTHPNHENVVVGAGFSGHGFKFASVVGEILADLALEGETDLPIDPFAVERFR